MYLHFNFSPANQNELQAKCNGETGCKLDRNSEVVPDKKPQEFGTIPHKGPANFSKYLGHYDGVSYNENVFF